MEEVVRVTKGFRPDFAHENPTAQSKEFRTMKTTKFKRKKGKRVLKRVYHEGTSACSSYSSLISDYVDIEPSENLEPDLDSNIIMEENLNMIPNNNHAMPEIQEEGEYESEQYESESSPELKSSSEERASASIPADEDLDSQANLKVKRNAPRESFKVFNQ